MLDTMIILFILKRKSNNLINPENEKFGDNDGADLMGGEGGFGE